jgi:dynein heavy chain
MCVYACFSGDDMIGESDDWKKWFNDEKPELMKLPGKYGDVDEETNKPYTSPFQKLLLLRALRQDRLTSEIQTFIKSELGPIFVEQPPFDMNQTYKETSPSTPVFFVLFPGVDPTGWVQSLGIEQGVSEEKGNFMNISMGQGQEERAELTLKTFSEQGGWVFLQNVHLMPGWLPRLERTLEVCSANAHKDFRCFISAEPPPMPHMKTIPESLLQSCIKVANEAPADVKSNFRRAWANFSQEKIDSSPKPTEFKGCLFTICFFHSLILGRRKFGQQGWSRKYSFNTGDLSICADVCFSYIAGNDRIPWDDMRYIFGEIMYGGHITDPWDRRTNSTYLQVLLQPHIFDCVEMIPCYVPGANQQPDDSDVDDDDDDEKKNQVLFGAPDFATMSFDDVTTYIEKMLPPEAPVLFGLHPNAEIGYLSNQADSLLRDIIALGGFANEADDNDDDEAASGSKGSSGSSIGSTLSNLLSRLPEPFEMISIGEKSEPLLDIAEKGPFVIVAMQECTRMNVLINEIRRSLIELEKGLSGALNMSESMEDLVSALTIFQVPGRNPYHKCSWENLAWWSKKGLESWFSDMLLRITQLSEWSDELELPQCMWYPGLFNPMAFNTAIMQVCCLYFF